MSDNAEDVSVEYFTITEDDILQGRMGVLRFDRMMDIAEIVLDCREIKPGLYRRTISFADEITDRWERV